jgi:hypothetical protein
MVAYRCVYGVVPDLSSFADLTLGGTDVTMGGGGATEPLHRTPAQHRNSKGGAGIESEDSSGPFSSTSSPLSSSPSCTPSSPSSPFIASSRCAVFCGGYAFPPSQLNNCRSSSGRYQPMASSH